MTVSSPVAADVPGIFDLVVQDGSGTNGYVLVKDDATGLFYRPRRASYGTTPTFLERTNVQGDYGDDQQQFWMTFSQKDWTLGEEQRFFRSSDPDKSRRYWKGTNVDVSTPGQVAMRRATTATSTSTSGSVVCYQLSTNSFFMADDTNLYSAGASLGAHGAGSLPTNTIVYPLAADNKNVYIAGQTKIRKYNGSTFSDFSTTSTATSIAYLNNTLYSVNAGAGTLDRYDTSGVKTTLFTWKSANGTAVVPERMFLCPFGGKLVILIDRDVWLYDGTAPAKIAELPPNFLCLSMASALGTLFLGGKLFTGTGSKAFRQAVYYYASGTLGQLWKAQADSSTAINPGCLVAAWLDGVVISDLDAFQFRFYTLGTGGVHSIGTFSPGGPIVFYAMAAGQSSVTLISGSGGNLFTNVHPGGTTATSATITSSLFDGESSLDKYFKAVKVDFDSATDGDGGSVDIAYQLNTVDSTYTNVQTGATAGTEYTIGQTGRSVSIKVTLNKGTSTSGPVLKRIYVRAVPKLQQFRKNEYILELSGQDGKVPAKLRNGQLHNVDGMTMAQNLRTSIASTTPITVTDRFGTYTGIIEPDNSSIIEIRPEIFQAHLVIREI